MIGNDIVDICASRTESNWQRAGFLGKIFTAEEQVIISNSFNQEFMFWRLWTMKESAYKIVNRQTKIRAFIPKKLICNVDGIYGAVTFKDQQYYTKSSITDTCIYTVATYDAQCLNTIVTIKNSIVHKDIYGHPFVHDIQGIVVPVSVTHHGNYRRVAALRRKV